MKDSIRKPRVLPAEWATQDGVILAWPHADTDWKPVLHLVEPVFAQITAAVSRFERVILITANQDNVRSSLIAAGADLQQVTCIDLPTNDTWARDFGPITVYEDNIPLLLDFGFNGWGLKFAADRDNQLNRLMSEAGLFGCNRLTMPMILEGGSIESDGLGTLLLTSQCLLEQNRNPHLTREEIQTELSRQLGCDHFLWLGHGYLAGDDTDSHIDTLARLCPDDTILYVAIDDPRDEHFTELTAMKRELEAFRTRTGRPYRLIPLPFPAPCYGIQGERIPATYANFLIINNAVLVPTYSDPRDADALAAVQQAFPDREIIGIDCRPIILQHGSLHCLTMQLPKGTLA